MFYALRVFYGWALTLFYFLTFELDWQNHKYVHTVVFISSWCCHTSGKTDKSMWGQKNVETLNVMHYSKSLTWCVPSGFHVSLVFWSLLLFVCFFYQTERRRVADVRGSFANSAISPVRQYPPLPTPPTLPPPLVLHYPHRTLQMHSVPSGKKNPWLSFFPLFMSSVLPSLVIIRRDDGGNRLESSL